MIYYKMALRNLKNNWRHALAAIVSVAAGFVALTMFQGYVDELDRSYSVAYRHHLMFGDLVIENPKLFDVQGRIDPFSAEIPSDRQKSIEEFLEQHPDMVAGKTKFLDAQGTVTNGKVSSIFFMRGIQVASGAKMRGIWAWDATYGRPLSLVEDPNVVLLGQGLGRLMGCLPNHEDQNLVQNFPYPAVERAFTCETSGLQVATVTESGQLNAKDLSVVGLIDGGYKVIDDKWIETSLEVVQSLLNTDKVKSINVLLHDNHQAKEFKQILNQWLSEKQMPERAVFWQDHPEAEFYQQTLGILNVFKIFIVIIIVFISGLSVFNTMAKLVRERTREIGTLRSLGYQTVQVRLLFMLEGFNLAAFGGLIGLIITVLAANVISHLHINYRGGALALPAQFVLVLNWQPLVLSFLFLLGLVSATAWFSCRSIEKQKIAENLIDA